MTASAQTLRAQTSIEEIANSVSHGVALLAALIAVPFMIAFTLRNQSISAVIGVSIFGAAVILMYFSSMLYHAIPISNLKITMRKLDHISIYLLIAGTYTPFTLGVLRGPWGWSMLVVIWLLAATGIYMKTQRGFINPKLSTLLYILMGWLVIVAIVPLWLNMSTNGLAWLVSGGLAYTGGTLFYVARSLPFSHLIWHLFVIAGTSCHFMAVAFHSS